MNKKLFATALAAILLATADEVCGQNNILTPAECDSVSAVLSRIIDREVDGTSTTVQKTNLKGNKLTIEADISLSYYPFREDNVKAMRDSVRAALPPKYRNAEIALTSDGHAVEEFIPQLYRSGRNRNRYFTNPSAKGLVTPLSRTCAPSKGLAGRHIAMWHSHGRYFNINEDTWSWQRPALWRTREDLFTMSFVVPYLAPMLEKAGAYVLLPRERDWGTTEIIIDNDGGGIYAESNGTNGWYDGGIGFAHKRDTYLDNENPFTEGTYRAVKAACAKDEESTAVWGAEIPERRKYAVYVSYRTVKNSCDDAVYTVRHLGGESRFQVNQTMGGGTWIYLGDFMLDKGLCDTVVTLSNRSAKRNGVITADAVKIGGGYGNIARIVPDSMRLDGIAYEAETSGLPRFCEGARYWLQWAGFPYEVYSKFESTDDYKDDYTSRAHWVNALAGGSKSLPKTDGLHIPVDMSMAFHSDAGVKDGDATVGTLGIYSTRENGGRFAEGTSRFVSRDLTDVIMTQIIDDIRTMYEPDWVRRAMWDRLYYEARYPNVPTMLLELLGHSNFADMRYGLDPRFKFTVSRAIYKGILRHIAAQYGTAYCVAPLPVRGFSAVFGSGDKEVFLRWHGVEDPLEPTASPARYILYTRIDDGDFDNGQILDSSEHVVRQQAGHVYSYRIAAVNDGGESFPSETLTAYIAPEEQGRVLIINAFDRVSAPVSTMSDSRVGFEDRYDSGAAYISEASFIGEQRVFDPSHRFDNDDRTVLGASYSDREGMVIAGNTFDYPRLHGLSIGKAAYSYCSASVEAFDAGEVPTDNIDIIDYIAGKQRATTLGTGYSGVDFKVFTHEAETRLRAFAETGGSIFVSGSYIASDVARDDVYDDDDRAFVRDVLHCELHFGSAAKSGAVNAIRSTAGFTGACTFNTLLSETCYAVDSPDALKPSGDGAFAALRYTENGTTAGTAYDGGYRCVVWGFPFETVERDEDRDRLMSEVIVFLSKK